MVLLIKTLKDNPNGAAIMGNLDDSLKNKIQIGFCP